MPELNTRIAQITTAGDVHYDDPFLPRPMHRWTGLAVQGPDGRVVEGLPAGGRGGSDATVWRNDGALQGDHFSIDFSQSGQVAVNGTSVSLPDAGGASVVADTYWRIHSRPTPDGAASFEVEPLLVNQRGHWPAGFFRVEGDQLRWSPSAPPGDGTVTVDTAGGGRVTVNTGGGRLIRGDQVVSGDKVPGDFVGGDVIHHGAIGPENSGLALGPGASAWTTTTSYVPPAAAAAAARASRSVLMNDTSSSRLATYLALAPESADLHPIGSLVAPALGAALGALSEATQTELVESLMAFDIFWGEADLSNEWGLLEAEILAEHLGAVLGQAYRETEEGTPARGQIEAVRAAFDALPAPSTPEPAQAASVTMGGRRVEATGHATVQLTGNFAGGSLTVNGRSSQSALAAAAARLQSDVGALGGPPIEKVRRALDRGINDGKTGGDRRAPEVAHEVRWFLQTAQSDPATLQGRLGPRTDIADRGRRLIAELASPDPLPEDVPAVLRPFAKAVAQRGQTTQDEMQTKLEALVAAAQPIAE